ncbi:MAG: DNA gyrase subunit B [Patescibacteria group bacterium]|nr:DNA gyrase subunit B [bacterium]MDZ4240814.1 DNA gyrase subunit B [Patescibacteria group bacterium]
MPKKEEEKKEKPASKKGSYSAQDITVLEGLEPVRRRPGMYIGTTSSEGLHHLIWEIFDNSRDEAMGGFSNRIEVALLSGNRVRVADNGRGIPVDVHKQTKVSALETIMTTLHAGGKFGGEGYKVSGGLHGVGGSVVNALSIHMKVSVHRDGGQYVQEYAKGKKKHAVKKIGSSKMTGTIVTFEPDEEIFKEISFDLNKVMDHMRQQAYLVRGLRIVVIDARGEKEIDDSEIFFLEDIHLEAPSYTFCFEGGLVSLVSFYNKFFKPIHKNIFYTEKHTNEYESVEIALQYVDDISSRVLPFANNIYNSEGGMHVTGFKTALTRTINNYARNNNLIKEKEESLTGEDVLEGLTAVVAVKLREIQFEGQTKAKLGSLEARGMVESVFSEGFTAFLEEHPDEARSIINKVLLALKARKAAKAAKDSVLRKGALEGMMLPGKLADCQSKSAEESELFIVEGDSAGGTAKSGRDRRIQAILPLRGKILNIERARLDKALASEQIKNLVVALGASIGDSFDITNLRYHKVIIATDADVDGAHIRTLLLTMFYRFLRGLLDGGFIYIAQPPLYKISKGKEVRYAYSDNEKLKSLKDLGVDAKEAEEVEEVQEEGAEPETVEVEEEKAKRVPKVNIQRYKGLGEMNAEELWETTMDPKRRILKQVTIDDAREADKIFEILMGDDVASRKSFIQSNAHKANLDI